MSQNIIISSRFDLLAEYGDEVGGKNRQDVQEEASRGKSSSSLQEDVKDQSCFHRHKHTHHLISDSHTRTITAQWGGHDNTFMHAMCVCMCARKEEGPAWRPKK